MRAQQVTNAELFLWSLYLLGGLTEFVDVENVYLKAFDLAPRRLAWRTRPDLPDYKKCAKGLRDAEAQRPPLLVKTSDGYKRQLTVEGREWIAKNEDRLAKLLDAPAPVLEPARRATSILVSDAEASEAFQAWRPGGLITEKKWQVADLLRCSPDSDSRLWRERLEVLRSVASDRGNKSLLEFLNELVSTRSDWFGGN